MLRQRLSERAVCMRYSLLVFLLVVGGIGLLLPLQGAAQAESAPPKRSVRRLRLTHFYDTPQPLPAGKPGDLIRSEAFDDYDLPLSVNVVRILYHSRSARGEDVASSGVVLFPAEKKPPAGGWPVIAWAHGSTDVARQCAPSLRRNLEHGPFLSMYVNLGYAVVATDYTGLGTSYRNAFLDAPSNAADVIASIPAGRAAVPQLASRWIVMGDSEGGLAAIAVAEKENEIHDAVYLGAVVIADIATATEMYEDPTYRSSSFRLASLAYGTKTVYPEFKPADVLTDKGLALYEWVGRSCSGTGTMPEVSSTEAVKPGWSENKFVREYLERTSPARTRAYAPILVISSSANQGNSAKSTSEAVSRMCKQGDQVQWEQIADLDPGRVIGDSVRDQIAWIEGRLAGRPAVTNCH